MARRKYPDLTSAIAVALLCSLYSSAEAADAPAPPVPPAANAQPPAIEPHAREQVPASGPEKVDTQPHPASSAEASPEAPFQATDAPPGPSAPPRETVTSPEQSDGTQAPVTPPSTDPNVRSAPAGDATTEGTDTSLGPLLELAEEHDATQPNARGSEQVSSEIEARVEPVTSIGGYAQFNFTSVRRGFDADFESTATLRRLVLMVGHQLSDDISTVAELEWENAIACASCAGSVEVEQAYVDWRLLKSSLVLRAGLLLIPMGIVNQWHEPPVFNGVERPSVDQDLIPTTWRELGAGFHGQIVDSLRYEAYLVTTFSPSELNASGLAGARGAGSFAPASSVALSTKLEYEPALGFVVGASGYAGDAGPNGDYFTADGAEVDLFFPIFGAALHARYKRRGIEAKLVGAAFWMPESLALLNAYRSDGVPHFPNVDRTGAIASRMQGGYAEIGYDVLSSLETTQELVPFARIERVDNQAAVPNGYARNGALRVDELTAGVSYRPMRQLVFKFDTQLRDREHGLDELSFNAGLGYMY